MRMRISSVDPFSVAHPIHRGGSYAACNYTACSDSGQILPFAKTGSLATESPQIVEFCATYLASLLQINFRNER